MAPVSLSVTAGSTVGLVGPNGSGKSTLIRAVAGLLLPSTGTVAWTCKGLPLTAADMRAQLGYVPQSGGLVPGMRVADYLSYMCWMKRMPKTEVAPQINRVLAIVDLSSAADRRIRTLSGGMRRRVLVAQALLGSPGLLLLDEPTAGLDADQCSALRETLSRVAGSTTILLATHMPDDLDLAEHVVSLAANPQEALR